MPSFNPKSYLACLALLSAVVGAGCAGPNAVARSAARVDFATLARAADQPDGRPPLTLPFVLHVAAGQEVPLDFQLNSRVFALDPGPLKLVAKRDFYVLFRDDGPPLLSEDGQQFEVRPQNTFRFGLRVVKHEPAQVELYLGIRPEPQPAAPH
ncbi:MAG TPA: hypothetical protein VG963_03625 [Polyangiaceae bacterium]|nr:hypothetical protein [Polyangiaceae bacterium]